MTWGQACSCGAQLPALSVPGDLPLQQWAAAMGAAFFGECQEDPQDEIATWPVLPPYPRHGRGQVLLAAQAKWGARRTPTATLLFSSLSNSDILFFVWTWHILITLLQEGSHSSLFLDVFLQADDLADLVTIENPQGFCL